MVLSEFLCGRCHNKAMGEAGTTVVCPSCNEHVMVPGPVGGMVPPPGPQQHWGHPQPVGMVPQQQVQGRPMMRAQGQQQAFWYQVPSEPVKSQQQAWSDDQSRIKWEAPLLMSGCYQPLWFLCGYCCLPCTVWVQRRKLLLADQDEGNWRYYHCCAGIWGPSLTGHCDKCTNGNEMLCSFVEACCCAGCAMHGNRYMVQLHYGLENTCCDIFLMWLSCICSILACITGNDELELIADILYYLLMGCMAAQHENEMQKKGYPRLQ
eukprot:TRINITY_DN7351_c0_g1_i1.p1 TRINITY_DN7351_c0_g1~~TRINITY_DN7351_c0_g1_i1.p1  ORF type:complete len:264 (+),score=40.79 TRINITY_DN7351_c0_g1_i1:61-852(+)